LPQHQTVKKKLLKHYLLILSLVCFFTRMQAQLINNPVPVFTDRSVNHLSEAIRIKTISYEDHNLVNRGAFVEFRKMLEKNYPLVHQHLQRVTINEFSYIYKWQGSDSSLPPYIFLAHQDVVPIENETIEKWSVPPFSGRIQNDSVWGRGAADDKVALIGLMEATESLLEDNFQPRRTIYLCFGHDEEISGGGAEAMAAWFKEKNIHAELVLDEGMEVIQENYFSLKHPIALIGVGEKGFASLELVVEKPGGHSSAPELETAIDILTSALARLHNHPSPAHLTQPVAEFFHRAKKSMPHSMRFAINNQGLFKKKILKALSKNNGTNAAIRTTIVTTIVSSGMKDNVIPAIAKATINCRILPGETVSGTVEFIRKTINDDRVRIHCIGKCWDPSSITSTNSAAFKKIESLIPGYFPGAIITPMFVIGATDSRHFRTISDGIINFNPLIDSKGLHGIDERMSIKDFKRMIAFYTDLMKDTR
jgi:carboxypeptidase PM20D1